MSVIELEQSVVWTMNAAYAENSIVSRKDLLKKQYEIITGDNSVLLGIAGNHGTVAVHLWFLGRQREATEEYRLGVWFDRWWWRLHRLPAGTTVELPILPTDDTIVMHARSERHGANIWISALVGALMVNDLVFRDLLLDGDWFDPDRTDKPWQEARGRLWRSLFRGDGDVVDCLASAQEHLDVMIDGDPLPFGGLWKDVHLVEYQLIRSIVEHSQVGFDAAVLAAHDHHVAWYSSTTQSGTPQNGNISVILNKSISVLIRHGVQTGLVLNYASPYFVDWSPWLEGLAPIAPEYEPV